MESRSRGGGVGHTRAAVNLTDAELVVHLIEGRDDALAEVYRRHGSRVIGVANAVLRDRAAAEDICQDVFVQLARHPQKFDGRRAGLCTYLVVMAHARAVDRLRSELARARREEQQARVLVRPVEGADGPVIASSMAAQMWAAVNALPPREAEALRLAYFGGSTYREVAHMLEVAEGTVKSRIRSGLRRLRVSFLEQGIITAT
jgi:RNA polymerase sigma-70 factor (ECF subfamily)